MGDGTEKNPPPTLPSPLSGQGGEPETAAPVLPLPFAAAGRKRELEGDSFTADKPQRLFFALWPDDGLRADIAHAARGALRRAGGKPVAPENYHVTLKFLGSVNAAGWEALCAAADALHAPGFDFALDRIGHWPRPRILWLGAGTVPAPLAALVQYIDAAAQACGIDPEIRPYRPHVSLARKVRGPVDGGSVDPVHWRAETFVLAESETASAGARYRVLRSWPLSPKL